MNQGDLRTELDQLEEKELAYVLARSKTTKEKEAIAEAGYGKTAWYEIDETRRDYLRDLAIALKRQRTLKALLILDDNAEEAAKELVNLLDSKAPSVRLGAAKEILDRTTGKPTTAIDVTSAGQSIAQKAYVGFSPDEWDDDGEN